MTLTARTITIHAMKKHDAASERNESVNILTTLTDAGVLGDKDPAPANVNSLSHSESCGQN
jgi:hypothetical protein